MLILDENLSYKIAKQLRDIFPGVCHVSDVKLLNTSDLKIWDYALKHNLAIVTFDADFLNISMLRGCPPKIVLLKTGNRKTKDLVNYLSLKKDIILEFIGSSKLEKLPCLELH